MRHRNHIRRFTNNSLDLVASPCTVEIARKRPLAHTPMLHLTAPSALPVTLHLGTTPVGLPSHFTEISSRIRRHIDTHVMGTSVVVVGDTLPASCISSESHACGGASLKCSAIDVEV